ncbi:hypothetical protein G3576_28285 [Roseomonas stagni]|uniref:Uncharacterized protein n=1 Tax=Falsiroseomonas algicola TaxID=2716930 RepID=A0A6M1LTZ7_9PROT|nr:hypothetical protein [Falsiroseomonas algicola]NGM23938.1 hypothetical protein [Falsiroseomonas algicola]
MAKVLAVLAVLSAGWVYLSIPAYLATIVVVSEVPLSDVNLSAENRPSVARFQGRPEDALHVFEHRLARGARPESRIWIGWRSPDGRQWTLEQRIYHEGKEARCVHVLRVDVLGVPVQVGSYHGGLPHYRRSACQTPLHPG